jgi:plasmid stability protein
LPSADFSRTKLAYLTIDCNKYSGASRFLGVGKALDLKWHCCDTVIMKNITVTIDEKLHRRARVRAAELDKSLSAVVREFLIEFAGGETDYERRKSLQQKTLESIRSFRAKDRLSREEIHDRALR